MPKTTTGRTVAPTAQALGDMSLRHSRQPFRPRSPTPRSSSGGGGGLNRDSTPPSSVSRLEGTSGRRRSTSTSIRGSTASATAGGLDPEPLGADRGTPRQERGGAVGRHSRSDARGL